MRQTKKKVSAVVICIVVLAAAIVCAAILYPDAKFVFSGMSMQNGSNGNVQGFVNLRLKNVNATGVSFTIKYDEKYIVPSDYNTNEATEDFSAFYVQNTDNFPVGSLSTVASDITGSNGTFTMVVMPDSQTAEENLGANIGFVSDYEGAENRYRYIAADDVSGGLDLGMLSFQIVDPAGISQMTDEQLKNIFSVVDDSMRISYYDTENKFCTETIEYEWNIETTLIDVQPVKNELSVLAPDIYNDGTSQDLIDYLNMNYRRVLLKWSNGDATSDNIGWDSSKCTITGDAYDQKGGSYTVTQKYNDSYEVSVAVNVEKVILTGFSTDNTYITYKPGEQPDTLEGLSLPSKAKPVIDKVLTLHALSDVDLDFSMWNPNELPEDFRNSVTGTYEFSNTADISSLTAAAPWLTVDGADTNVSVFRTIGEKTEAPLETEITASVDKTTGVLTINVAALNGAAIEKDTTFKVKFPNGYVLDAQNSIMTETVNEDGSAVIVIATSNLQDSLENAIQSMINLGSDKFAISAKAPDKGESDFTGFISPKRENFYTQNEYIDYSEGKRSFFKITAGMALTDITQYVTLLDSSVIHIAYDGLTGQQPATMSSVHVDGWTIKEDPSATNLPSDAGETVTLVGTMTDGYYYTNEGLITNTDGYVLELKVTTSDKIVSPENEAIKITTNETEFYEQIVDDSNPFYFDTKQTGYNNSQIQTFTIHNIGTEDIEGLSVHIDSTDFVLVNMPEPSIEQGTGKTTFNIAAKAGLSAGMYSANVTVSSNANTDLKHFTVYFKVTNGPVYKVTVTVNDSQLGFAHVIGSTYYEEGETVSLIASPAIECVFKQWVSSEVGELNGSDELNPTFSMPAGDVTIQAVFEETIAGKLRLADLKVKNPDNSDNSLRDSEYVIIPFSQNVYEYYVTVPYETEQNKIWVKPKNVQIDTTQIIPVIDCGGVNIPCALDGDDGYYKTDLFDLAVGQNVYIITQTFGSDSKVYTVIIERKQKVNVTWVNGNSPYGLIDSDVVWSDEQKQSAKEYFSENYCYDTAPSGAVNTAAEKYFPEAWVYKNFDEDSTALFVYNGKAFVDPGFSTLKDTEGNEVDPLTVKRTIKAARINDVSDTNAVSKLNNTTDIVDTIISGGTSCVVNTIKNNTLRPGIYKIVYSFTDFDGSELTFSRPLVVLYDKGDTDLTAAIDNTDYTNIYDRMTNGISHDIINNSVDWCAVYAYRICDVNSDRHVNSIDANNVKSKIKKNESFTKFYEELPESL
ncbi:MAG: hypothetical protein ACI4A5_11730 [Hominilimicola sp.]